MSLRDAFCISPVVSLTWAMALFTSSCIDKASLPVTGKMHFALLKSKKRLRHMLPWLSLSLHIKGQKLDWIQGSETHWIPRSSCFPCLDLSKWLAFCFWGWQCPFHPLELGNSVFLESGSLLCQAPLQGWFVQTSVSTCCGPGAAWKPRHESGL